MIVYNIFAQWIVVAIDATSPLISYNLVARQWESISYKKQKWHNFVICDSVIIPPCRNLTRDAAEYKRIYRGEHNAFDRHVWRFKLSVFNRNIQLEINRAIRDSAGFRANHIPSLLIHSLRWKRLLIHASSTMSEEYRAWIRFFGKLPRRTLPSKNLSLYTRNNERTNTRAAVSLRGYRHVRIMLIKI